MSNPYSFPCLIGRVLGDVWTVRQSRISALTIPLIATLLLSSPGAALDASPWVAPGGVHKIAVVISDSVKDGCWPRPDATREAVELIFRSAGIEVFDQTVPYDSGFFAAAADAVVPVPGDKGWPHAFVIELVGGLAHTRDGQTPIGCTIHFATSLERAEVLRDFRFVGLVSYGRTGTLLMSPDRDMQKAITEEATEAATSLANAILKAR